MTRIMPQNGLYEKNNRMSYPVVNRRGILTHHVHPKMMKAVNIFMLTAWISWRAIQDSNLWPLAPEDLFQHFSAVEFKCFQ